MYSMLSFGGFILCAVIIFLAGSKLSVHSAIISRCTGLSNAWIGLVLLASITSLPELVVGVSSSAIVESADLATGDVLGSCAFNMAILGLMDLFMPNRKSLFGIASSTHIMAGALVIVVLSLVGVGLFLPDQIVVTHWIGLISILFIILYFFSMRLIYLFEKRSSEAAIIEKREEDNKTSLRRSVIWFSVYAMMIIASALLLPTFANSIADQTGIAKSFVGTFLLAASTSLPEIAVSVSAVRSGFINLAVGNLFGSNLFNIFILAIDDLVYTPGPILKDASDVHLISVFSTIIMVAVAIIGLMFKSATKRFPLAWDSFAVFLIYLVNLIILYTLTTS